MVSNNSATQLTDLVEASLANLTQHGTAVMSSKLSHEEYFTAEGRKEELK